MIRTKNPVYIECRICPGMFSNERVAAFGDNEVLVNVEDTLAYGEKDERERCEGCVKIKCFQYLGDSRFAIGINDVMNHRISTFQVSLESMVAPDIEELKWFRDEWVLIDEKGE